jgi:putative FmdB family regulatory protein
MPVFEYRCKKCGEKFEKLVMNKSEKIVCSKCGSEDLEKLFSTFGFSSGNKFKSSVSSGSSCSSCSLTSCDSCS